MPIPRKSYQFPSQRNPLHDVLRNIPAKRKPWESKSGTGSTAVDWVISHAVENLRECLVDNLLRSKVTPVKGSIVYCELAFGVGEHSGVYVGDGKIVHLDGSGSIESATPTEFINRLDGLNNAISIYVSCIGNDAVGGKEIAARAIERIGRFRNYNVILDNCHQFTSGCITGKYENADNFLVMLKRTADNAIKSDTWRVWKKESGNYLTAA